MYGRPGFQDVPVGRPGSAWGGAPASIMNCPLLSTLQENIRDKLHPIALHMNYSLEEKQRSFQLGLNSLNAYPVLNEDQPRENHTEVRQPEWGVAGQGRARQRGAELAGACSKDIPECGVERPVWLSSGQGQGSRTPGFPCQL